MLNFSLSSGAFVPTDLVDELRHADDAPLAVDDRHAEYAPYRVLLGVPEFLLQPGLDVADVQDLPGRRHVPGYLAQRRRQVVRARPVYPRLLGPVLHLERHRELRARVHRRLEANTKNSLSAPTIFSRLLGLFFLIIIISTHVTLENVFHVYVVALKNRRLEDL